MKKTLVIALAAALAVPSAFAEDAAPAGKPAAQVMAPGKMDPEAAAEHLDQRVDLGLTDDQKQKIQALMQEQRAKQEAIRLETRNRMDGILTPEQRQKFDAHKAQMMEKQGQRQEMRDERKESRADKKKSKQAEKAERKERNRKPDSE